MIGSFGLIFFLKNQNDIVLVKKNKNQRVATGFLIGLPGHSQFFFSLFFLNPARFQTRVDPSSRDGFQNYEKKTRLLAPTKTQGVPVINVAIISGKKQENQRGNSNFITVDLPQWLVVRYSHH